jgi:hypothetical protein
MLLSHDDVERRMLSAICHMDSGVTGQVRVTVRECRAVRLVGDLIRCYEGQIRSKLRTLAWDDISWFEIGVLAT